MRAGFIRYAIAFGALLPASAWAQVGAPVLGYLPVHGRILPVRGIAASASIGQAIDFGGAFLQTAVSPRQDFALVSAAGSGAVLIAYPGGNTTAIDGATASPSKILLSPSGSAAVLWYAATHTMQILSGLPSAPVARSVSASFLGGSTNETPTSLAVSDDGNWGAGAWSSGVWAFGPNGEVTDLLPGTPAFALGFFAGREDLAVATANGVTTVTGVGGSSTVAPLYSADGLSPSVLAISRDNSTILLLDRQRGLMRIDAASGAAKAIDCGCSPDSVTAMGDTLFRITGLTGAVFRVYDIRSGNVYQIPLAAGTTAPVEILTPLGGAAGLGGPAHAGGSR